MPKVTISIPTYNRKRYLEECLESIFAQSYQDFEIIIFDNHSDYDVESVLGKFKADNIRIIKNDVNIGATPNLQRALNYKYESEYVVIFHDDDVMHPELLNKEVEILNNKKEIVFVASGLHFISNNKPILKFKEYNNEVFEVDYQGLVRLILNDFDLCFSSTMYRAALLKDIDVYLPRFFKWSDRPFLIDMAKNGKVAVINNKLVNYRIHDDQGSQSRANVEKDCLFNLFKYYHDNLSYPLNVKDKGLFNYFSTNQLILSGLSLSDNFKEYRSFIKESISKGLLSYKYINMRGLYYLLKAIRKFL